MYEIHLLNWCERFVAFSWKSISKLSISILRAFVLKPNVKRELSHKFSHIAIFDSVIRYPNYTPILLHAVELWHREPQVTTPVLKLFAELVQNRSQRLQFDASSPNGILLFREASKIICSYGNHILNVEVSKDQIYPLKLKGISICFSMLKAALCGSYVNFGVFRLYGDEALDNALNTFVKLLLSIPQSDLLVSINVTLFYYFDEFLDNRNQNFDLQKNIIAPLL